MDPKPDLYISMEVRVFMRRDDDGSYILSDPWLAGPAEPKPVMDINTQRLRDLTDEEHDAVACLINEVIEHGCAALKAERDGDDDLALRFLSSDTGESEDWLQEVLLILLRAYLARQRTGGLRQHKDDEPCACAECLWQMWTNSDEEGKQDDD